MAQTRPTTGPVEFEPAGQAHTEMRSTKALEFIASRLAGIEWQLVELNEKLFRIAATAQVQATSDRAKDFQRQIGEPRRK